MSEIKGFALICAWIVGAVIALSAAIAGCMLIIGSFFMSASPTAAEVGLHVAAFASGVVILAALVRVFIAFQRWVDRRAAA